MSDTSSLPPDDFGAIDHAQNDADRSYRTQYAWWHVGSVALPKGTTLEEQQAAISQQLGLRLPDPDSFYRTGSGRRNIRVAVIVTERGTTVMGRVDHGDVDVLGVPAAGRERIQLLNGDLASGRLLRSVKLTENEFTDWQMLYMRQLNKRRAADELMRQFESEEAGPGFPTVPVANGTTEDGKPHDVLVQGFDVNGRFFTGMLEKQVFTESGSSWQPAIRADGWGIGGRSFRTSIFRVVVDEQPQKQTQRNQPPEYELVLGSMIIGRYFIVDGSNQASNFAAVRQWNHQFKAINGSASMAELIANNERATADSVEEFLATEEGFNLLVSYERNQVSTDMGIHDVGTPAENAVAMLKFWDPGKTIPLTGEAFKAVQRRAKSNANAFRTLRREAREFVGPDVTIDADAEQAREARQAARDQDRLDRRAAQGPKTWPGKLAAVQAWLHAHLTPFFGVRTEYAPGKFHRTGNSAFVRAWNKSMDAAGKLIAWGQEGKHQRKASADTPEAPQTPEAVTPDPAPAAPANEQTPEPSQPTTPRPGARPAPSQPEQPTQPAQPEQPSRPEQPAQPAQPTQPAQEQSSQAKRDAFIQQMNEAQTTAGQRMQNEGYEGSASDAVKTMFGTSFESFGSLSRQQQEAFVDGVFALRGNVPLNGTAAHQLTRIARARFTLLGEAKAQQPSDGSAFWQTGIGADVLSEVGRQLDRGQSRSGPEH